MMVPPAPTSTEFPRRIPGRLDVTHEPCESSARRLLPDRDVQPPLVRERFARHPAQPFGPARLRPGDAVRRLSGGPLLAVTTASAVDHAGTAQCAGDLPLRAMARRSQLWAP